MTTLPTDDEGQTRTRGCHVSSNGGDTRGPSVAGSGVDVDDDVEEALRPWGPRYRLTRSELAVIERVLCGRSNKEVGRDLGVSIATVRTHLGRAFDKTGVDSRGALAYKLLREVQTFSREVSAARC